MTSRIETLRQSINEQRALHLSYNGSDRIVSPTKVEVAGTGNTVLTVLERGKGYRVFVTDKIQNLELGDEPHEDVSAIERSTFDLIDKV